MKHLLTITNKDFDPKSPDVSHDGYKSRQAARAVVTDASGRVPLLFVSKHNYHKLPGGGVEVGEDMKIALARELLEEIGCEAEANGEVGEIVEYRESWNLKQISYCYIATQHGKINPPDFTESELREGFEIKWLENLETAIKTLKVDKPDNYEGKFIQKRDLTFLLAALTS